METAHDARRRRLLVAFLLTVHVGLAVSSSLDKGEMADEAHYVGLGRYLVRTGFDCDEVTVFNGPLPLYWGSALVAFLDLDDRLWETDVRNHGLVSSQAIAHQLLYEGPYDPRLVLFLSRLPFILLSAVLGLAVYATSRNLFGDRGGLVSLVAYAFCPVVLAHSQMVVSDFFFATAFFLAVVAFRRYRERPTWGRLGLLALTTGAAAATKLPAVLLGPTFLALVAWGALTGREVVPPFARPAWLVRTRSRRALATAALLVAFLPPVAAAVVWASYGFHAAPLVSAGERPHRRIDRVFGESGVLHDLAYRVAESRLPAPEYFRYAYKVRALGEAGHPCWFRGERSIHGWWWFYPALVLVKTPLPALALVALGLLWPWGGSHERPGRADMVVPVAIVLAAGMTSDLMIAIRYVLPAYPFLLVLAGRIGAFESGRAARLATAGLLVWLAGSSLAAYPHYLSYFHEGIGGPRAGRHWFVDGNLDWGQDVPLLADVSRHYGIERFEYVRNWPTRPEGYGAPVRDAEPGDPRPGVYAAGATDVSGVYHRTRPFVWLGEREPALSLGGSQFVIPVEAGR